MRIVRYQDAGYAGFVQGMRRRAIPGDEVSGAVRDIVETVREGGDEALCELTAKFDGAEISPDSLRVSAEELAAARAQVSAETVEAVAAARRNIHDFAAQGMRQDWKKLNAEGVEVGERFVPFDRVGIYVPGGKAPLVSTALMTGAFAQAAGVPEIVAMTPPGPDGSVNPNLLYALAEAGATEIYKAGGAQAVAALAYGTQRVAAVDKIFGPGNRFVVEAKRQVVGAVAIDLLPGPSEVLVIADETGKAAFLAADLIAQAEHGPDGEVGFLTDSEELLQAVEVEVARQLVDLPRREIAEKSLAAGGFLALVPDLAEAVRLCNDFAPEHLVLVAAEEEKWLDQVRTAGAIYVGNYAAVAVGDFLAGPSHTLPTAGAGRSFSGLRPDQFQRRTSVVRMDQAALRRSQRVVEHFAEIEGLAGHGRSVSMRALE
ncbi:MAG: histidinol dehydrogenase [Verrucomicrobiales bacterium]